MTSVVVRTTANHAAGAKSKMSAIIHGVLLVSVVISRSLNRIPLATLAAVLVGYKLANPKTIIHFWKKIKYINLYLLLLLYCCSCN
jgi:MFS superfamily sulfate permease-like transporter